MILLESTKQYKKIQNYIIKFSDLIGEGNFSKVYKAQHQITKELVAIKIIDLNKLKNKKLEQLLFSQIDILKKLNHPNVLKCHEAFTSNHNCYIVTELCNQGDLQSKLQSVKAMKEHEAQPYIRDIFKGLLYLANNSIVHRDIKIANIFLHNGQAKIADFGFAQFTKTKFKDNNVGSPIYMSPQGLINRMYGPKTDIWAFGILIYQLLHGQTPFAHSLSQKELKRNVSIPIINSQLKKDLSKDLKEVIMKCLQVDDQARISAQQLSQLNYFINNDAFYSKKIKNTNILHKFSLLNSNLAKNSQKYHINLSLQGNNTPKYSQKQLKPYYFDQAKTQQKIKYVPLNHKTYHPSAEYSSNLNKNSSVERPIKIVFNKPSNFISNQIVSVPISFKQCVVMLHLCRLIFKHLISMKEAHFIDNKQIEIKRWLLLVLRTIQGETRSRGEEDKTDSKYRKLLEVINQYLHKYAKQLQIHTSQTNQHTNLDYKHIYSYFISHFHKIDRLVQSYSINKQLLYLGHSIILICQYTNIMKSCYDSQNFKKLQGMNEIQEFLSTDRQKLDMPSYQWFKKKYWAGIAAS